MSFEQVVIDAAVRAGVVEPAAVNDPEGFDGGHLLQCLREMARLLSLEIEEVLHG